MVASGGGTIFRCQKVRSRGVYGCVGHGARARRDRGAEASKRRWPLPAAAARHTPPSSPARATGPPRRGGLVYGCAYGAAGRRAATMSSGFEPITAVFYAVFHPTEGTKIVHQVPEVISRDQPSLFDFDAVRNYVIPKAQLCNKLVLFKIGRFRVMGYPVNIENTEYARNSFTFNFCFVFPYDSDTAPYELAVRRMGRMFRVLEEQNFLLSKQDPEFFKDKRTQLQGTATAHTTPGYARTARITLSSIELLINQIFLDLNNYSECCIPLDSANSVDIKLFPILPAPVNIKAHQVPIATVKLALMVDVNWDPTMVKILPYVNGVHSVRKISRLADADYILTKQCLQHLLYYRCIEILDIFQFGNTYAPTNNIARFLTVPSIAEDCQAYIVTEAGDRLADLPAGPSTADHPASAVGSAVGSVSAQRSAEPLPVSTLNLVLPLARSSYFSPAHAKPRAIHVPSKATLFYLYRSLSQNQTIREWYVHHRKQLQYIDVRRFITFGVLRGLIYRVHSYPMSDALTRAIETGSVADVDNKIRDKIESAARNTPKTPTNPAGAAFPPRGHRTQTSITNESSIKTEPPTPAGPRRRVSFNYGALRHPKYEHVPEPDTLSVHSDSGPLEEHAQYTSERQTLFKLLKGFQNMDAICTELLKQRSDVEALIDSLGSSHLVNG